MPEKKESKKTSDLKKKLVMDKPRVWDSLSAKDKKDVSNYSVDYMDFLNKGRTERRAINRLMEMASEAGFIEISQADGKTDRVYKVSRGKLLVLAVLGQEPMIEGIRLVTSHVDSPRLDIKPNPLYEETGLALLKTHYYGGVKKYHWVARSLAMIGTMFTRQGKTVEVEIGLKPNDPVLTIPDLLPHL